MADQTPIQVLLIDKSKEELVRIVEMQSEEMQWYVDERNRLLKECAPLTPYGESQLSQAVAEAQSATIEAAARAQCPFCAGTAGTAMEGVEQTPQVTATGLYVHCMKGTYLSAAVCAATSIRALSTEAIAAAQAARDKRIRDEALYEAAKHPLIRQHHRGAKGIERPAWRCRCGVLFNTPDAAVAKELWAEHIKILPATRKETP